MRLSTKVQTPAKQTLDPLQPRGNLGETNMPPNKPHMAMVSIPETVQMMQETSQLHCAIVIDARLK